MASHIVPKAIYYRVFAGLLVLTALTIAVAHIDLGFMNNILALGIAGVKAVLVALFFMHLRYETELTWVFAWLGVLFLAILFGMCLMDFLTRSWQYLPQPWS